MATAETALAICSDPRMDQKNKALESWMRSKRLMSSLGRGHRESTADMRWQLAGVLLHCTLRSEGVGGG